jgi:hypothetical protein
MMAGCNVKEEGELGAVYRGGEERSESLVLIPYLAMVSSCTQLPVLRERVFYCKGNLAVLRLITQASKG